MREMQTDILIVGGGTGGVAAALSATSLGHRVILTEQYPWLGGQLTSQLVPPDENAWINTEGPTARYRSYREQVRQYYRDYYPLTAEARFNPRLNPGGGTVSGLCHEPRVGAAVIDQMLAPLRMSKQLTVLQPVRPTSVDVDGDHVRGVTVEHVETGEQIHITAAYVLDATELGDLLPMSGTEYVSGAESKADHGEMHAIDGPAEPDNVQALTWCFAMAYDPTPGADYTIDKPEQYEFWRDFVPALTPAWSGRLLCLDDVHPVDLSLRENCLFSGEPTGPMGRSFWDYRQIVDPSIYDTPAEVHAATSVNWPMNDYMLGSIIDHPDDVVAKHLAGARQLSLSLFYWLQTDAPNPTTGGTGYPGLYLRSDLAGTDDGLAQAPYIRESRRIKAEFTVTEAHVGKQMRWNRDETYHVFEHRGFDPVAGPLSEAFDDTVGIGSYAIDLHPSTNGRNYVDVASTPFQIPLGALIPQRMQNLLPACKNLGVTHITNGCYRLHPVEWNIGEVAGLLAAYCLKNAMKPTQVRNKHEQLRDFQGLLGQQGVPLNWPWQKNPLW